MEPRRARPAGLCDRCAFMRLVVTPRSEFLLCERSKHDPAYERYPRLPVRECAGWASAPEAGTPPREAPERGSEG